MPGTSRSRPAAAASRSSAAVLDPERGADLHSPASAEAEQAAESGELGRRLPAKLLHLGQPPGLDELAEPGVDPGPDPAQLAGAAAPDEVGHRNRGRCDEFAHHV